MFASYEFIEGLYNSIDWDYIDYDFWDDFNIYDFMEMEEDLW